VIFTRSNITDNSVESGSSGLTFDLSRVFQFDFCAILSNQGSDFCIHLSDHSNDVIRCLSIHSNDGKGSSTSSVFSVRRMNTINNGVIANKTNMGFGMLTGSGILRFVNCYFDTFAFTWSGGNIITTECVLGGEMLYSDPICVFPQTAPVSVTPIATATSTATATAAFLPSAGGEPLSADFLGSLSGIRTASLTSEVVSALVESGVSDGLIAGVVVGVLVIVVVSTGGGVIRYRRCNGKGRNLPLEEVEPETIFDSQIDVLQASLITGCPELESDNAARLNKLKGPPGLWDDSDD
jgi:hypothetical protein